MLYVNCMLQFVGDLFQNEGGAADCVSQKQSKYAAKRGLQMAQMIFKAPPDFPRLIIPYGYLKYKTACGVNAKKRFACLFS